MSGSLTRFLAHPAALVLHNNSALKSLCLTVIIEPLIKICTHPIWNQGGSSLDFRHHGIIPHP